MLISTALNKRTAWLLLLAAAFQASPVFADVTVGTQLADQYPPLAHVSQAYDWQFLKDTFSSDSGSLTFSADGLPSWAKIDSKSGRITGNPSKSGSGDQTSHVTITASEGGSKSKKASSAFDLVTIAAPAPTLKTSLQDQLPKAASMGQGNMMPNKVLHLPLGWSFSIGFDGDTFVLPQDDHVHYSTYLAGAKPLPSWLVFNEEEMTYSGIAPTNPGPNGTYFDVILFGSNRPNTGGPSSNFTIYVAGGIITSNSTAGPTVFNVTEGQPFSYGVDALNTSTLLVDGKPARGGQFEIQAANNVPDWISYDSTSHNITGKAPFETKNTNYTQTIIPLQITHDGSTPMDYNVTMDVYPSPFNAETLPNATVSTGKEFEVRIDKLLRDTKTKASVDFGSDLSKRSIRFVNGRIAHHNLRRAAPSWLHYDDETKKISGTAPDSEQQLNVQVSAANPVPNAPVPDSVSSFTLFVRNGSHPETAPGAGDGLSPGEKGAIAGSILGAALLAAIAGTLFYFCCYKRRRRQAPVSEEAATAPAIAETEEKEEPAAPAEAEEMPANAVSPYIPQSERPYEDIHPVPEREPNTYSSTNWTAPAAGTAGVGAGLAAGFAAHKAGDRTSGASAGQRSTAPSGPATNAEVPSSPQWQRADEEMNPTPFLAQSHWTPPVWTQMAPGAARNARTSTQSDKPAQPTTRADLGRSWPRTKSQAALPDAPFTSIDMHSPPQGESDGHFSSAPETQEGTDENATATPAQPESEPKRSSTAMGGILGGLAAATGLAGLGVSKKSEKDIAKEREAEEEEQEEEKEEEVEEPRKPTILSQIFGGGKVQDEEAAIKSSAPAATTVEDATTPDEAEDIKPVQDKGTSAALPHERASWEDDLWYGERDQTANRSEIPAAGEAPRLRHVSGSVADAPRPLSEVSQGRSAAPESQDVHSSDGMSSEMFTARTRQTESSHEHGPAPLSNDTRRVSAAALGAEAFGTRTGPAPRVASQNWVRLDDGDESISYLGPVDEAAYPQDHMTIVTQPSASETVAEPKPEEQVQEDEAIAESAPVPAKEPAPASEAAEKSAPVPAQALPGSISVRTVPSEPAQPTQPALETLTMDKPVQDPAPTSATSTLSPSPMEPGWDDLVQDDGPMSPVRSSTTHAMPLSAADAYVRSPPDAALEQFAPWQQFGLFSPTIPDPEQERRALASSATAPQLGPVVTGGMLSPLPTTGTPQLSPVNAGGIMSPLASGMPFGSLDRASSLGHAPRLPGSPTQPLDAQARFVPQHQARLEEGTSKVRPGSQAVEPQELTGMFDDADNDPAVDPFAGNQYPYGTVLGQTPNARPTSMQPSEGSSNNAEEFRGTEGAIAQMMFGSESDAESRRTSAISSANAHEQPKEAEPRAPVVPVPAAAEETPAEDTTVRPNKAPSPPAAAPPRSSTMASIQMAQSRSVSFSRAKPPRLQLMSCRPDEAISLPLMSSQVSIPHHLLDQAGARSSARYLPQLFAPSRPDLHEKWPSWLSWLSWDAEQQELTGTVPPSFAEEHRLPMQLPIHILLENGHQILQESGQERPDPATASAPLLVARILLTVLPAAQPREP